MSETPLAGFPGERIAVVASVGKEGRREEEEGEREEEEGEEARASNAEEFNSLNPLRNPLNPFISTGCWIPS